MKFPARDLMRALRLPFITASALPFIFGSLIGHSHFKTATFLFGLTSALSAHLSANLINDFADSVSGADWQDRNFYGFFGGSKLIQEGVFSRQFYFILAASFGLLSFFAALALAVILKSAFVLFIFAAIIILSWAYSAKPLQLSYHRLGEIAIFILFGPALVMGGYFLQTNIFPDIKSFMLSLPFGFLTTAILYANEIPDLQDDVKAGKFTWASVTGAKKAYLAYCALIAFAFLSVILNVGCRFIDPAALISLLLIFIAAKAAAILKNYPDDKKRLVISSQLTIAVHLLVSLILIGSVIV